MATKARGCPRCGGRWKRESGFVRCMQCGHVLGSQDVESPLTGTSHKPWLNEDAIRVGYPQGPRVPLDFEEK
jgi:hypothetical protein